MMKSPRIQRRITTSMRSLLACVVLLLVLISSNSGFAFEESSSCNTCHGDFDGPVSPKGTVFPSNDKHVMHRGNSSMNTDCGLCHDSNGDDPLLENCAGCHVGAGLRAHHAVKGETTCYTADCHAHSPEETPPAENVKPPYYGTAGTNVDDPCNGVLAANVGENWSIGDFLGLDNDGDNLYDLADFDCGPPYRIVGLEVVGNDIHISWETAGGRTDMLQATPTLTNNFNDVGSAITIPGVGLITNTTVEVGGVTPTNRFYRIQYAL